jgi:hypothetical protein
MVVGAFIEIYQTINDSSNLAAWGAGLVLLGVPTALNLLNLRGELGEEHTQQSSSRSARPSSSRR